MRINQCPATLCRVGSLDNFGLWALFFKLHTLRGAHPDLYARLDNPVSVTFGNEAFPLRDIAILNFNGFPYQAKDRIIMDVDTELFFKVPNPAGCIVTTIARLPTLKA